MGSKHADIGTHQRIYRDIINGYSTFRYEEESVFVKHLTAHDTGNIEDKDRELYNKAKGEGLPTEEEKLGMLIEQEVWSNEKEQELLEVRDHTLRVQGAIDKLIVTSQVERQRKILDKLNKKISDIEQEKAELLGLTCESYSMKRMNQEYLRYSLRSDGSLKHQYLDEEKYDSISDSDLDIITILYNAAVQQITGAVIKRVAAHPFFLNSFLICENDPFVLFGKPVCHLSNYQIDLFANARRFKSVLEQGKSAPQALYEDIQSVVDWYESNLGAKTPMKADAAGATVFGATGKELKAMVDSDDDNRQTVSLDEEAKKTGKKVLNMQDLLKLHGEI